MAGNLLRPLSVILTGGSILAGTPARSAEVPAHSYDYELRSMTKDGLMIDAELEALMVKLGDKKRPIDDVRDFSLARQAMKELEAGK